MDNATHTTETLRKTLLDTIEKVLSDTIEIKAATAVATLAGQVIKTAELEIKYTQHMAALGDDKKNPDQIAPGPLTLAPAS